jgi:hypothetical protein
MVFRLKILLLYARNWFSGKTPTFSRKLGKHQRIGIAIITLTHAVMLYFVNFKTSRLSFENEVENNLTYVTQFFLSKNPISADFRHLPYYAHYSDLLHFFLKKILFEKNRFLAAQNLSENGFDQNLSENGFVQNLSVNVHFRFFRFEFEPYT